MKRFLYLLALLWLLPVAGAHARTFRYALLVHSVGEQVKVEVYAFPDTENKAGLSIAEAVEFLKHAPRSRGANRIGIMVEGCPSSVCAPLLRVIIDSPAEMELSYFGDFGADQLRRELESHQQTSSPSVSPSHAP